MMVSVNLMVPLSGREFLLIAYKSGMGVICYSEIVFVIFLQFFNTGIDPAYK